MRDSALVSVITRTVDRPTLARSLASAASQSYASIEIVVVDAGGTGVPGLPAVDRPLRVVSDGRAHARGEAANIGLEHARGDYLMLLDDDDEIAPTHVQRLVHSLAQSSREAAYSDAEAVDAAGNVVEIYQRDYSLMLLHHANLFPCHAVLFSRRMVEIGCRFDIGLSVMEDWDFWLQVAEHTDFVRVPGMTARYHIDAGNSGAGRGVNRDAKAVDAAARRIADRWKSRRAVLAGELLQQRDRAFALFGSERRAESEPLLQQIAEFMPDDSDVLAMLAYFSFRCNPMRAAALLKRAMAHSPPRADLHFNRALAFDAAGDAAAALAELETALTIDAAFDPGQRMLERLETAGRGDAGNA
jgi:glycosyltransferase involved in cell wall biosynthesis